MSIEISLPTLRVEVELGATTLAAIERLTDAIARLVPAAAPPRGRDDEPARGTASSGHGSGRPSEGAARLVAVLPPPPGNERRQAKAPYKLPTGTGFEWTQAQDDLIWSLRGQKVRIKAIVKKLAEPPYSRKSSEAAVYARLAELRRRREVNADPKDTRISVAARMEAEMDAARESAPVAWDVVEHWAVHNHVPSTGNRRMDLQAVNRARAAEGLPPFRVTLASIPGDKLPPPKFGVAA